jgi:hypothetical protein
MDYFDDLEFESENEGKTNHKSGKLMEDLVLEGHA